MASLPNDVTPPTPTLDPLSCYLEWRNDFLTIEAFADYHHISDEDATALIKAGRLLMTDSAEKE